MVSMLMGGGLMGGSPLGDYRVYYNYKSNFIALACFITAGKCCIFAWNRHYILRIFPLWSVEMDSNIMRFMYSKVNTVTV